MEDVPVHEDCSGVDSVYESIEGGEIFRPDGRGESIRRVINQSQSLFVR